MGNRSGTPVALKAPRAVALAVIAVLVAAASGAAFAESYRGLYDWAARHGLHGAWAVIWPLQVDVFIAVGELALFVALVDRWKPASRTAAWAVTAAGLAVSVAGNVGHVASHSLADRVTAAVPPVAAAGALAVALGILKRVVEAHHADDGEDASGVTSEPVRVTEGRPPSAWLDDQILALLPRMSVRSTAEAFGVSKTRVETAKRRAALAAPERGANYRAASSRGGAVTPSVATPTVPAAQDVPAGERPPSLAGASPNGRAHA